jgi:hypothetical protein
LFSVTKRKKRQPFSGALDVAPPSRRIRTHVALRLPMEDFGADA